MVQQDWIPLRQISCISGLTNVPEDERHSEAEEGSVLEGQRHCDRQDVHLDPPLPVLRRQLGHPFHSRSVRVSLFVPKVKGQQANGKKPQPEMSSLISCDAVLNRSKIPVPLAAVFTCGEAEQVL